jgi:hypothetical protein
VTSKYQVLGNDFPSFLHHYVGSAVDSVDTLTTKTTSGPFDGCLDQLFETMCRMNAKNFRVHFFGTVNAPISAIHMNNSRTALMADAPTT